MKAISVVVSTYTIDRFNYVLDCIESLKKQTVQPKEIILVLDPEETVIDFYKSHLPDYVKIVISEGFGLSNARNAGVKNSRGEIIAFIDDDATADENWLENLANNYGDRRVVGVGGFVEPIWESDRPLWFPEELDWIVGCSYKGGPKCKTYVRNPIGCNMSFRKDIFRKVGYFRGNIGRTAKKLISGEETEFSIRVLEKFSGLRIMYEPSAIVHHRVPKTRMNLKYILKRSLFGGFSIGLIVNSSRSNEMKVLTVEERYLEYLLRVSFPTRLRQFYDLRNMAQLFVLFLCTFLEILAYFLATTF